MKMKSGQKLTRKKYVFYIFCPFFNENILMLNIYNFIIYYDWFNV